MSDTSIKQGEATKNQPDHLRKLAVKSACEQRNREKQLLVNGWRWIKDVATRSYVLAPPI